MFSAIRCLCFGALSAGALNQDFQDFEDLRERLWFRSKGNL
jgi:hypothetical protein